MQYEKGLWPYVLKNNGIKCTGHSFTDKEVEDFCSLLYKKMQDELVEVRHNRPSCARELSSASSSLGRPGEKRSLPCINFRRDLRIVLEAAGSRGGKLVLSDDTRFIETVIQSEVVFNCFKRAAKEALGIKFKIRARHRHPRLKL